MRIHSLASASLASLASLALATLVGCGAKQDVIAVELGGDDHGDTIVFDDETGSLLDEEGAGPVRELETPFLRVGVRFNTTGDASALELRTSVDGAVWSDWRKPELYFSDEDAHAGHIDLETAARFVQHRIVGDAADVVEPSFIAIETLEEIPPAIPEGAVPVSDDDVDAVASTATQGLNLNMVTRSQWGARAPNCKSFTGVRRATIHHTAGPNDDTTSANAQMRQIQSFHMNTRGWCDVGYNFLVSRDGKILEGRGYGVLGAHTADANGDNMGISFIGTYTSATPPEAQFVAAAKVLRYLKDRAGTPLSRSGDNGVKGHRQRGTTATSCPGDKLYSMLGTLVTRAANSDFSVGPPIPAGCRTGNYDGAFCDDDGNSQSVEASHNKLKNDLGVNFHCSNINGHPAYCGTREVTRAQSIFVLGKAAGIPTAGHPNAFSDDNGHANEKYMNAAKAFGIFTGSNGNGAPDGKATRSTIAVMLKRMYLLPPADRDYFDDDDDNANEDAHNRVAAAGLMAGFNDANGGRKDFKPTAKANRSTLSIVAVRAANKGLIPRWDMPAACVSGNFDGNFCDDDTNANAQASFDRLIDEASLPGMFCSPLAGSPRFCASKEASRAMAILILGGSAGIPLAGHPDGFSDDNDHPRERYLDAAKAFGIFTGYEGGTKVKPTVVATRDTLATMLVRMYALPAPPAGVDYFDDDNGTGAEATHNKVGHAGLFTGFDAGNGKRHFRGSSPATKGQLATLAQRAKNAGLVPVWVAQQQPSTPGADEPVVTPPSVNDEEEAVDDSWTVDDEEQSPVIDPENTDEDPAFDEEPLLEVEGPGDGVLIDDHFAPPELESSLEEGTCTQAGAGTTSLLAGVALLFLVKRRARASAPSRASPSRAS
jgi:hypothetical protein